MVRAQKVPLYVSLKNVEALETSDLLLERIERALAWLEGQLTLVDCHVTVEGDPCGACRVHVDVTLPEQRQARSCVTGRDICSTVDGAFGACGQMAARA
jgi:hypothetical protein